MVLDHERRADRACRCAGYRLATQSIGATVELDGAEPGRARRRSASTLIRAPEGAQRDGSDDRGRSPFAGAKVANLSPRLAQRLGMHADIKGVVVVEIDGSSPAARVGFQPRDIVVTSMARRSTRPRRCKQAAEAQSRLWRFTIERDGKLHAADARTLMADLFGADDKPQALPGARRLPTGCGRRRSPRSSARSI